MDLNENSAIGDPNEIIKYNYVVGDNYITRETNCGAGAMPFLGDITAKVDQKTVLVVNDAAGVPLFRYYDGAGTVIPAGSLPGRIPDIRRIEITLVVDTVYNDPNTGGKKRLVYSTSVIPRNHIPTYSY
jgi:hypothetical protein